MPNQRAAGQKLLNFPAKEKFITEIDRGVEKSGLGDRSKFVREAIVEKLERLGIVVPPEIFSAPSRAGKGDRPTHKKPLYRLPPPPPRPGGLELNEEP